MTWNPVSVLMHCFFVGFFFFIQDDTKSTFKSVLLDIDPLASCVSAAEVAAIVVPLILCILVIMLVVGLFIYRKRGRFVSE